MAKMALGFPPLQSLQSGAFESGLTVEPFPGTYPR